MNAATFDSNILVDALKDISAAHEELRRYDIHFISRVTWIEVMVGALPDDGERAEGFMKLFKLVELDDDIARRAAMLRAGRRRLKLGDGIILATAQARGTMLVTRNTRDFPADTPGVRVPYSMAG